MRSQPSMMLICQVIWIWFAHRRNPTVHDSLHESLHEFIAANRAGADEVPNPMALQHHNVYEVNMETLV